MIYLINKARFKGVECLNLSKIEFKKFKLDLSQFDALIITSKNALKALKFNQISTKFKGTLYAVGEKTVKYAMKMGFENIKFASKQNAKALFDEFKDEFKTLKILYLRGENVAFDIKKECEKKRLKCEQIIAYKNVFKPCENAFKKPLIHPCVLIFSSPLSVEFFLKIYQFQSDDTFIAIGKSTQEALFKALEDPANFNKAQNHNELSNSNQFSTDDKKSLNKKILNSVQIAKKPTLQACVKLARKLENQREI